MVPGEAGFDTGLAMATGTVAFTATTGGAGTGAVSGTVVGGVLGIRCGLGFRCAAAAVAAAAAAAVAPAADCERVGDTGRTVALIAVALAPANGGRDACTGAGSGSGM